MENESFASLAMYYDLLYKDKDYNREVDFIASYFKDFKAPRILELGCGTGNYTKILAERGYDVTGVDLSKDMLEIARQKCDCKLINGDIRSLSIEGKFDVCLAMFAVIGYITENSEIVKVLKNVHQHLKPNGLFIFDVWNGLAVMRILPSTRMKRVENDTIRVIRFAEPTLRSLENICEVN